MTPLEGFVKLKCWYSLVYTLLIFTSIYSQSQLTFKHITMQDGLPDDGVEWVIQDHLGFLWIATRIGMVRYDGYEFVSYKSGGINSFGLDQDRLRVLYEDSRGDIWAGADGYLNRYVRSIDSILTYKSNDEDENALHGQGVYSILEDSKGNMWFGNYRGWLNYIPKQQLESYERKIEFKSIKERGHKETYIVYNLLEDRTKNIWACTRNGLMKIIDFNVEVIQAVPSEEYDRNNTFFSMVEDSKNKYWLGTYGKGLAFFNDSTKTFEFYPYRQTDFKRYSSNNILSLLIDRKDRLWAGTQGAEGGGLLQFDRNLKRYKRFTHIPEVEFSLMDGAYFHNIIEDNSGTIWMPAFQKGITRMDPSLNQPEYYYYGKENDIGIENGIILTSYEAENGIIWSGTTDGLLKYDIVKKKYEKVDLPKLSCGNKYVIKLITEDQRGYLWLSSGWSGHLWEYDPINNSLYCFTHDTTKEKLTIPYITGLESDQNRIWISTYGGGLNKLDPISKTVQRYFVGGPNSKKDDPEEINKMAIDASGSIWVASYDRTLNKFDKQKEDFLRIPFKNLNGGFNTTGMLIDSQDRIWLATRLGGIIIYNIKSGIHKNYTIKDGLPANDNLRDFFEDSAGNIYCRTTEHLLKFTSEGKFDKYFLFDLGKADLISAYYVKPTNEIFLTTSKTLLKFPAGGIRPNQTAPKMVITDFRYFDKSIKQELEPQLRTPISLLNSIELEHYQNDFSIKFTGLHYTRPNKNEYKYILENYDDNWKLAGTNRTVKYTNLSHGKYLFKVLGSNCDGIWATTPATIEIIINPPWWLTWWAYSGYAIIIISVIAITWILQLRRIRIKNELKMKEFESAKLKEVDNMKSNFFANISHEFRTPLTLIKGPIERFLYEEKKSDRKEVFKMVLRNTNKLLNLINELLDLSKLEAGKMKLCVGKYDIISFTKGIVMSFSSLAESKEINLFVKSNEKLIELYFDKVKMQKIISNLISNALKFTPERGSINVSLKKDVNDNKVIIEVIDSGMGVPENELPKLFDRFYQVIRDGSHSTTGTGIGLALTKELVSMHHGKIAVKSKLDEGTTFTIEIPLGREHFSDEDIMLTDEKEFEFDSIDLFQIEENILSKNNNKSLVLVVEDNDDVLKFIHDTLKKNYNVICAKNGEAGYKIAMEKIPDLIVSDIMMPIMDGNKMCELIRKDEKTSHIPVILLTAKAEEADKIEGLETGADDYIIKPFDSVELIVRINNLISQRHMLRQKYLREAEIHPTEVAVTSIDKLFIEKAIKIIEKNIDNSDLGIENFAEQLAMSRSQLYRKFCAVLGEKPNEFIRKYRLKRAADLLKQNFGNITQIAYEVGFNDPAYFAKCFKKLYKMNPFEYEKKLSKNKDLENKV